MLCLTRRIDEGLTLRWPDGRTARVVVNRAVPGKANLGVEADADCTILRDELEGRSKGSAEAATVGFPRRDVLAGAVEVGGRAGGEELSNRNRPRVAPANVA